MYNSLRLMLVLMLAPMLAMAQAKDETTCPDVKIDLSGLRVLDELDLESMADLKQLKQLAVLESMPDLAGLKDLATIGKAGNFSATAAAFDAEKRKTINKSFKVSAKDALRIENQWGKVHVNTWDKKEIQVTIEVIARASSDAKAQEMLNRVKIQESREGSTYTFRTQKESMRMNGNKSLEVNYTINMPAENAIAVKNRFGDVYLASMKGKADIDLQYGSLKCDRLANTANTLKITYGAGNCGYIGGGNISVAYTEMKVGGAGGLQGSSKFSDFSLGGLEDAMEMDVQYGSFRVDNISKSVQKISLDGGFTPLYLNFADNTNFNFDVNVSFGNFNVDKSLVTITSLERDHTSAEYKGKFGNASSKAVVSINSKYGDVKFTK
ncbi:hypothetical protein [Pontibacter mangrovi]|uniref:Adhesin domain-containing protein n=1 Tax=Pontibacter mangrovi TaxID=2589816 RepID=A0A501W4B8_9BACT|nr:hypothetical protein [Pontibacter mangrovi]TPE44773.1 hypothetical protein FJM65_07050 [Pontibacter mangrovi]